MPFNPLNFFRRKLKPTIKKPELPQTQKKPSPTQNKRKKQRLTENARSLLEELTLHGEMDEILFKKFSKSPMEERIAILERLNKKLYQSYTDASMLAAIKKLPPELREKARNDYETLQKQRALKQMKKKKTT